MRINTKTICIVTITLCIINPLQPAAITYPVIEGSRFGDHLLSYMHAKWIAYKYGATLLYRPFIHSDELVLDSKEQRYNNQQTWPLKVYELNKLSKSDNTPYFMSYFPESAYELKTGHWNYFAVDWSDKGFIDELRKMIQPKNPVNKMVLPSDKVTVAMHVRRGGSFETFNEGFPVKFPHSYFYVDALNEIYEQLGEQELFVYIFTDDQQPDKVAEFYQNAFHDKKIIFEYRHAKNDHYLNVIDDFFALAQFDCLIRPDSNFTLCASKLNTYLVEISPSDCALKDQKTVISSMLIKARNNHQITVYEKQCTFTSY